jgi:hypothetical protein
MTRRAKWIAIGVVAVVVLGVISLVGYLTDETSENNARRDRSSYRPG